ncbi:MAG TPA: haloacid dehalogenase type II [Mycobacteriales bacterium]|jgi:2-haloacid dehalogenase|nr:haloacid dehalogenase type II [Mycobacteriales bacterium]
MVQPPQVIVFDVNETLSDLTPMGTRFADVGAPAALIRTWFAVLLRDGFALTAAGGQDRFARLADGAMRSVLTGVALNRGMDEAVDHVMAGFAELPVHADVPGGVRALRAAGIRLVTLTNGAVRTADELLTRAGLRAEFEALHSVDETTAWKPAPAAYAYICQACAAPPAELMLVAVHPWDIDGAARAGLRTAWLNRGGASFPAYFTAPELDVSSLGELADRLTG